MNNVITVILYGKEFSSSLTLNNLLKTKFNASHLVIVNNGPEAIESDRLYQELNNKFNSVVFFEFLENKSLATIYNFVINNFNDIDRYIFFDDDTRVTDDFFNDMQKYYNDNINLQIPRVVDLEKSVIHYPHCNGQVSDKPIPYVFSNSDKIISIGSGLVIYKALVDLFNKENLTLFDERFALYGVDYSFFHRIEKIKKNNNIYIQMFSTMEHSLSKTSAVFSDWRHREHLYDYVISSRFYSNSVMHIFLRLMKCSLKELLAFRFRNLKLIVSTFLKGHHPRC
ncbi:glycosyltransferase [Klebsiella pneumoniae]|uniref:hypothetical protein n=1 Tax=Klebsiella pneumoniae TaxID=573 RepID=UPI000E2B7CEF|nr:hypothetical protein [Klebsiella pneumoniae]SYG64517.1 glycosyltransferase [Klebsiella pneumoniae]